MIEPGPGLRRSTRGAAADAILITGGAGFIGSRLAASLVEDGHRVLALDDLSGTGGSTCLVDALLGHPSFEFHEGSAKDRGLVQSIAARVGRVVHLAGTVGVRAVFDDPERAYDNNLECTRVVLGCAAERGLPTLIASSSEVYGTGGGGQLSEDDALLPPADQESRSRYARAKWEGEQLALELARTHRVRIAIARLFNVTGPGQLTAGMVIPSFVRQALCGEPITVYDDGRQTRCFMHVEDAASAIRGLLESEPPARAGALSILPGIQIPIPAPLKAPLLVNVGSDEEVSILELARRIKALTRSRSRIEHVDPSTIFGPRFVEPRRRVPDLSRLRALGFEAHRGLDDILHDTIEWMTRK